MPPVLRLALSLVNFCFVRSLIHRGQKLSKTRVIESQNRTKWKPIIISNSRNCSVLLELSATLPVIVIVSETAFVAISCFWAPPLAFFFLLFCDFSHGLRQVRGTRVVNVMGAKLKDHSELETEDDKNSYYFHILILFYPFRAFEDLGVGRSASTSSWKVFMNWEHIQSNFADNNYTEAMRFIEFNDAYYEGKQRAKVTQAEFSTANGIDATAVEAELMNGVLGSSDANPAAMKTKK